MNHKTIDMATKGFKILEGKEFYFYGVNENKFKIDDLVFEALEDPNDGYRSSLGAIVVIGDTGIYHKRPLAKVKMVYDDSGDDLLHKLIDIDTGHVWLAVGTGEFGDYYPYFMFRYKPDETQKDYIEVEKDYQPFLERYPELMLKAPEWFNGDLDIKFEGY
ncbi:MAG: hypothetical protein DRH57_08545 [Candidatus Cloacimonadota bacterium]|nr:MAG: hypothetical protein DRH57_08545 [Candidatus Cloacimonadota bacterium]